MLVCKTFTLLCRCITVSFNFNYSSLSSAITYYSSVFVNSAFKKGCLANSSAILTFIETISLLFFIRFPLIERS